MNHNKSYTEWSLYMESIAMVVLLVLHLKANNNDLTSSIASAAFANALAVGVVGCFIGVYGKMDIGGYELLRGNAMYHVLPMFVACLVMLSCPTIFAKCQFWKSNVMIWVFASIYLGVPYQNTRGLDKIKKMYGVQKPFLWALCMLCTIHTITALLHNRTS